MSHIKNHQMEIEERGYKDSDKSVCASHFNDSFIVEKIRYSHNRGQCSFCGRRKNVLPFNDMLELIAPIIRRDYLPAIDNAIYDSERKRYLDPAIDPYDFVHDELNEYLGTDESVLRELMDTLTFEERVSPYNLHLKERQEEKDLTSWDNYCQLVKETKFSAEQIVSLSRKDNICLTEDIISIRNTLDTVWSYCRDLYLVKTEFGQSSQYSAHNYYRCISYLPAYEDDKPIYEGLTFIPATLVGTAPAKLVKDNRMSEAGDMMFYGADDKNTAMAEVGGSPGTIFTMGTFQSNKRFRILDLSEISKWKLPSIFDIEHEERRSSWFFLKEFMERISEEKIDADSYKPTQVFTKYIQRRTDLQGIRYKSTKTGKPCYVLFVVNRDCLDPQDRRESSRNQLVMVDVEQIIGS